MDENIWPKKNVCFSISDRPYQNMWIPPPPQKKLRDELPTVIKVTIKMLQIIFGPFHEV